MCYLMLAKMFYFSHTNSPELAGGIANLQKHRGSVHNLQLDIMDGIVQVGKV